MTGRLVSRLKANAGRLVAIVLVVGVFVFVLPRVANYHDVWEIITGLSTRDMAALVLVALLNLATFAPPWMAALPGPFVPARPRALDGLDGGLERAAGRRRRRASASPTRCCARWGFGVEQVAVGTAATTVWNAFANVIFAVAGVVALADRRRVAPAADDRRADRHRRADRRDRAVRARAAGRRQRDPRRRAWPSGSGTASRALIRRPAVEGWDQRLVGFRREAIGLLRRRWLWLTLAHAGRPPDGVPGAARLAARRRRAERATSTSPRSSPPGR